MKKHYISPSIKQFQVTTQNLQATSMTAVKDTTTGDNDITTNDVKAQSEAYDIWGDHWDEE